MPPHRAHKKRNQIDVLLAYVDAVLPPSTGGQRPTVVDLCSGGGHAGLAIAYTRPDVDVVLLDLKPQALALGMERAERLGIADRVRAQEGDVGTYSGTFDLGIVLHACGPLTDAAIRACSVAGASVVAMPCCYGKLASRNGGMVGWLGVERGLGEPRSDAFRDSGVAGDLFGAIAGAADYDGTEGADTEMGRCAAICAEAIDVDRCLGLRECGYWTATEAARMGLGKKSRVVCGVAPARRAAHFCEMAGSGSS